MPVKYGNKKRRVWPIRHGEICILLALPKHHARLYSQVQLGVNLPKLGWVDWGCQEAADHKGQRESRTHCQNCSNVSGAVVCHSGLTPELSRAAKRLRLE